MEQSYSLLLRISNICVEGSPRPSPSGPRNYGEAEQRQLFGEKPKGHGLLAALYSYAAGGKEKATDADVACKACDPATDKEAEIGGDFDRTDRHAVIVAYIFLDLGKCRRHLSDHSVLGGRKVKVWNSDMATKDTRVLSRVVVIRPVATNIISMANTTNPNLHD
jgi:hypothetical protein